MKNRQHKNRERQRRRRKEKKTNSRAKKTILFVKLSVFSGIFSIDLYSFSQEWKNKTKMFN